MKSGIIKRSIVIDGHKTSVSLEDQFWNSLKEIARAQGATVSKVIAKVDDTRQQANLSSALRLFVLDQVQANAQRAHTEGASYSSAQQAAAISA